VGNMHGSIHKAVCLLFTRFSPRGAMSRLIEGVCDVTVIQFILGKNN
jgi:hypothetical protein